MLVNNLNANTININGITKLSLSRDACGYNSEYQDNESNTIYLRARSFSSSAERFIAQDSLGLFNRYSGFNGNPITMIDPSGHSAFSKFMSNHKGAIIANVISIAASGVVSLVTGCYRGIKVVTASSSSFTGAFLGALEGALIGGISYTAVTLYKAKMNNHASFSKVFDWHRALLSIGSNALIGGLIVGISERYFFKKTVGRFYYATAEYRPEASSVLDDIPARNTQDNVPNPLAALSKAQEERILAGVPEAPVFEEHLQQLQRLKTIAEKEQAVLLSTVKKIDKDFSYINPIYGAEGIITHEPVVRKPDNWSDFINLRTQYYSTAARMNSAIRDYHLARQGVIAKGVSEDTLADFGFNEF